VIHGATLTSRTDIMNLASSRFHGDCAKKHVESITKYYRTAGSTGYQKALEYAKEQLEKSGIHAVVETYPLDGKTELLGHKMALAWEPIDAIVEMVSPIGGILTSFSEMPTCIMWWSASTSAAGVEAEVVDVGVGVNEHDYVKSDVAGKIVLAAGDGEQHSAARIYSLAVEELGAVGILTDCLLYQHPKFRTRTTQPDLVQLFRLEPKMNRSWGIALSYNQAEKLRKLLKQGRVVVRVRVEAKIFEGTGQNLVWEFGPRRAKQQIMLLSHISATRPGANCASGPATMIEVARTLRELVEENRLTTLRRKIRFLIGAEGYGVSAYFAQHKEEIPCTVAALCLDSVGHDQAKCNSSIVLYRTPDSTPSFVSDLVSQIFADLQNEGEPPYKFTKEIPLTRFAELPYTPWSDNSTLTALGIPCPLVMSWPDKYFHTQSLDSTKTDSETFHFSGSAVVTVLSILSTATSTSLLEIANIIAARTKLRLSRLRADSSRDYEEAGYVMRRDLAAIRSLLRLSSLRNSKDANRIEAVQRVLRKEAKSIVTARGSRKTSQDPTAKSKVRLGLIPKRTRLSAFPRFAGLTFEDLRSLFTDMVKNEPSLKFYALVPISSEIGNLVDGHRSVTEIAKAIHYQYQIELLEKHVLRFLRSLEKLGYIVLGPNR
jgi:hypothetical protein